MRSIAIVLGCMVLFSAFFVSPSFALPAEEDIYFTRANIWYEHPAKILSTNYHKGTIIPIGTKVVVLAKGKNRIQFGVVDSDAVYTLHQVKRHSKILLSELFDRYFTRTSILASTEYFALTRKEKENIANGVIKVGMSKNAVLMAYGYPPTHKTLKIALNVWYYWKNRAQYFPVQFKDDVVVDLGAVRV